jgi:hypothetical protein
LGYFEVNLFELFVFVQKSSLLDIIEDEFCDSLEIKVVVSLISVQFLAIQFVDSKEDLSSATLFELVCFSNEPPLLLVKRFVLMLFLLSPSLRQRA